MIDATETQIESVKAPDAETFELAEAVIISGPLKGKLVSVKVTFQGEFAKVTPLFTPEEMEILRVYEDSKKAKAFIESEIAEAVAKNPDVTPNQLPPTQPTDN